MYNKFFATFVVALALVSFVSCDKESSYVGLVYEKPAPLYSSNDSKTEAPQDDSTPDEPQDDSIVDEPQDDSTDSEPSLFETVETTNSDEVGKVISPEWGEIVGADISAIPADDEDKNIDKKCLMIRTDLGAIAVVFSRDSFPEEADVVAGDFVEGNFDSNYNSAVFVEGNWVPAQAVDSKDRLEYLIDGVTKRNIRYTTLHRWDWQNKDDYFTTKVSGYDITVEDGVLIILKDGEQVMHIR